MSNRLLIKKQYLNRFVRSLSSPANPGFNRHILYNSNSLTPELQALLTDDPKFFDVLEQAQQRFYPKYVEVRNARAKNQEALRKQVESGFIDFRKDTAWIRDGDWQAAPIPAVLAKRPVELTGPANDAAMMINAFNTGSLATKTVPGSDPSYPMVKYMPDGEDSSVPTLAKELQGILNLKSALEGKLTFEKVNKDGKVKKYALEQEIAYPIYRVPGLHFDEATMVDRYSRPIPNHLLLTLLYQHHVAPLMQERGWVPSIYQPKLQSYEEACLVNDVIAFTEKAFDIPEKSTRITCLIETLSGALQAEEIVFGLRDYICGLNAGRWDYIFQWIQVLQTSVTPDRSKLTMQAKHLEAYMDHIRDVCERRGPVFMGGMSAVIPGSGGISEEIREKIKADKQHEQKHGAQGAWVAHPGMVQQVLKLFTVDKHWVTPLPLRSVKASELVTLEDALKDVSQRTEKGLVSNISSGVQYLASWLHGRGAVALNGLMEDMATAEISRAQLWQWLKHEVEFTREDGSVAKLTPDLFDQLYDQVVNELKNQNEVSYAAEELPVAIELFREMVKSATLDAFIADRAYQHLNKDSTKTTARRDLFHPVSFDKKVVHELLPGDRSQGEGLVLSRTRYLRDYFREPNYQGFPKQFWFAGTSNPLVGAATVLGGGGSVGSYLGGWDANAVNNVLNKRLPDTLNVWVNDATNGGKAINNHLRRDMEIEHLDYVDKLSKLTNEDAKKKVRPPFDWLSVPQLVDLEQGWRSIHHTRLAVDSAIDNGINVCHIEDQGHSKRCGHLGDKELAPFDSYCQILRAANLTAQIRLGDEQAKGNGVIFVSRTDALSAKRIEYSEHLKNPKHIDHYFVDFEKGLTNDGNYYYLKQGINPNTGNPYGLDLAIVRMAEVVNLGLAEYVWMETPNADLHVAKAFIDGVNDILAPKNKHAKMLYNHSPSFDWDLGFVKQGVPLGQGLIQHISTSVAPYLRNVLATRGEITPDHYSIALENIRRYVKVHGDPLQRDFDFDDHTLLQILLPALDLITSQGDIRNSNQIVEALQKSFPGTAVYAALETIRSAVQSNTNNIQKSQEAIFRAIADARLGLFGKASGSIGVELPLTTLPDFHYESFAAHRLAMGLVKHSMQAYVHQVQRPERAHFEAQKGTTQPYPYYKHQESTGTGVDARFGKALGSSDTKALEESTEADDLRDRKELEAQMKKRIV
eukprot:gene7323-7901_t